MTAQMGYGIPEPNDESSSITGDVEITNDVGNPLPVDGEVTIAGSNIIIPVDRQAIYHASGDNLTSQSLTSSVAIVGGVLNVYDKSYIDLFLDADVSGNVLVEHSENGVVFTTTDPWFVDAGVTHLRFDCILNYVRFSYTPDSNGTLNTFITKAVA